MGQAIGWPQDNPKGIAKMDLSDQILWLVEKLF